MNLVSRIFNVVRSWRRQPAAAKPVSTAVTPSATPRVYFDMLKAYYLNNGLYDEVQAALRKAAVWKESMLPLRNPAMRAVEVYASTVWPGALKQALEIVSENERIMGPIQRVWAWSNWAAQKQVAARWASMYGNLFIKVSQKPDGRPYFQLIEPQNVIEIDEDERGFIRSVRVDSTVVTREGENATARTRTEFWRKAETDVAGEYIVWLHDKGDAPMSQLPEPLERKSLSEFGIDFVPIVHAKQRDIGEQFGAGVYAQCLDKIDEANRMVTRLHQMLFRHNKVLWALSANAMDASGRPLPPPRVGDGTSATPNTDVLELGDDALLRLPGMSKLDPLVPSLAWGEALAILNAHMAEIEQDMPELAYYKLRDLSQVSGVAARTLLTDAIARIIEARGNLQAALSRADAMALTMGANAKLTGFTDIGDFASGDFAHTFAERPVISPDLSEMLDNAIKKQTLGVGRRQVLREIGYTDAQFEQWASEDDPTASDAADKLLTAMERR